MQQFHSSKAYKRTLTIDDVIEGGITVQGVWLDAYVTADIVQFGEGEFEVQLSDVQSLYMIVRELPYPVKLDLETFKNENRLLFEDFLAAAQAHAMVKASGSLDGIWEYHTGEEF